MTKTCSACSTSKPLDAFFTDSRYVHGVKNQCKDCTRRFRVARKDRHRSQTGVAPEMQRCVMCGKSKPPQSFGRLATRLEGIDNRCKACRSDADRKRRLSSKWSSTRKSTLWSFYGMTVADYDRMLIDQSGRCAICEEPMKYPHIDHSHETGGVRALLCAFCNTRLDGLESAWFMEKATRYLAGHSKRTPVFFKRKARALIDGEPCAEHVPV